MNVETKKHIDAARQVLVGVVPNPTAQIDQITNALIYKFMDDMDQSAIKQGGDPSFFIGNLKDYSWTRLTDTRIGNQERMNIYSEALVKFSESKQLPQLFREIFKSAFLPYRSPEVLGLFLKEINYFDYSHPEELGNAYEYLLSVMGSQGDAGQFRTPRHIIDFIVDVVNPTMEDKVLDPACGTSGFLVSAYKHILEQHDGKNPDGTKNKEKPLTPDQRKNLMNNFEGYDIDPGMVRIAQVNMYLHQFKGPKIFNYDTLTMEERWGDKFSVILANPPFMSPKGGVSTHSKFSIQSSRSEVLFVDYIMNHLRPNGRAGIIVPEGIIFQSGTAHKQLRKNLVEDGLCAVISLPSGVFQPYSGVKTSILIFNNELAKQSKEIAFIKIENDGFDLGATKRPISKNDLPEVLDILDKWKKGKKVESAKVIYVAKTKIAESGDYNLSGDRYRLITDYTDAKWPMFEIGELCELGRGRVISKKDMESNPGPFPVFSSQTTDNGTFGYLGSYDFDGEYVTWTTDGANAGTVFYRNGKFNCTNVCGTLKAKSKNVDMHYLTLALNAIAYKHVIQLGNPKLMNNVVSKIKIPLPPLEIQEQIVKELDGYQKIITGAKEVIENWKPSFIVDPKWDKVKLPDISENNDNKRKPVTKSDRSSGVYPYYGASGIVDYVEEYIFDGDFLLISEDGANLLARSTDIAFSISGKNWVNNHAHILKFKDRSTQKFVEVYINQINISNFVTGMAQPKLNQQQLNTIEIPFPSIEIQKQIVKEIESERTLIEGNKKLIEIYERKTKDTLAKLWEE